MNPNEMIAGIQAVTKRWTKQKKAEDRAKSARMNRQWVMARRNGVSLKEAAWSVMEKAYNKASSNGTLPAHARQIMYAARPEILELTTKEQLNDQYFTQTLLPEYIAVHACNWDVVYDARGHFKEPHSDRSLPLGTLEVRAYMSNISSGIGTPPVDVRRPKLRYPTQGPANRFGAVLFIEKEGFMPLFERVRLAAKFDIAIMSTKGVSNVASRRLVDRLRVPLFVLHDFDAAGMMILNTLKHGTDRYRSRGSNVIDLGLRLADVEKWNLPAEPCYFRGEASTLRRYGATQKEAELLMRQRVELNAFTSSELIEWIEGKLVEHGVEKVIPGDGVLKGAYSRAVLAQRVSRQIQACVDAMDKTEIAAPEDLGDRVREYLRDHPRHPWDRAIAAIAMESNQ